MAEAGIVLTIEGMGCDGCVRSVTQALESVPGVVRAEVSLAGGRATVRGDLGPNGLGALVCAVEEAGYTARPAD